MQAWDTSDGLVTCLWCGWCPSDGHVQHSPFCPSVRATFHIWVDDDGELRWRRRDFLWIVPRLLSWCRRATERVQMSYALDGRIGRQIIQEWSWLWSP